MTTSLPTPNSGPKIKTPKKKGPIRFEAIVPLGVIVLVVGLYFKLFFDSHLKTAIEWGGYMTHGAEVNVGGLHTSFTDLTFELTGLEVTDKNKPTKNLIKIDRIHSRLLWDALLRFKIVVEEAGITGIATWTDRSHPGRVKPPEPLQAGSGAAELAGQRGLEAAKNQMQGTALGDVANSLGDQGAATTFEGLQGQLKSKAYIEGLSKELTSKETEWRSKVDALPKGPELDSLKARIKAVKINTNNLQELQKTLQEIDGLAKEANSKIGNVNNIANDLKADLEKYSRAIQKVDEIVKEDERMLQNRLKIPSLDAKDLAAALFGPQLMGKLAEVEKYMRLARKYMPPKKTAEQKAADEAERIKAPPRGTGENFQFGRPNSYPLFWLKQAKISSKSGGQGLNGNINGLLTDVTSDPPIVGRPMILDVKGDFPEQKMSGVELKVVIDHVTSVAKESVFLQVGRLPVEGQMLSNTDDLKFGFANGDGSSNLKIELKDEDVDINLNNTLSNISYVTDAKNEHLQGILKGAVQDIPKVTLDASATGSWANLKTEIQSNLGTELQKAFTKQIQAKLDEAKKKVDEYIEKEIGPKKRELTSKFDEFKSQYLGQAEKKKEEVTQIENQAKGKSTDAQNSGKKEAEDKTKKEVEKGLNDLKKQFKF